MHCVDYYKSKKKISFCAETFSNVRIAAYTIGSSGKRSQLKLEYGI